jgi:hypothetical protein
MNYVAEVSRVVTSQVPLPRQLVAEDIVTMLLPKYRQHQYIYRGDQVLDGGLIALRLYTEDTVRQHWYQNPSENLSAGIVGRAHKTENNRKTVYLVLQHNHQTDTMHMVVQFMSSDIAPAEADLLVSPYVYRAIVLKAWEHIRTFRTFLVHRCIHGARRTMSTYTADVNDVPPGQNEPVTENTVLEMKYAAALEISEVPTSQQQLIRKDIASLTQMVDNSAAPTPQLTLFSEAAIRNHWHERLSDNLSAGIVGTVRIDQRKVFLVMQYDHDQSDQNQMRMVVQFMPSMITRREVIAVLSEQVYRDVVLAAWGHIATFAIFRIHNRSTNRLDVVSSHAAAYVAANARHV